MGSERRSWQDDIGEDEQLLYAAAVRQGHHQEQPLLTGLSRSQTARAAGRMTPVQAVPITVVNHSDYAPPTGPVAADAGASPVVPAKKRVVAVTGEAAGPQLRAAAKAKTSHSKAGALNEAVPSVATPAQAGPMQVEKQNDGDGDDDDDDDDDENENENDQVANDTAEGESMVREKLSTSASDIGSTTAVAEDEMPDSQGQVGSGGIVSVFFK